MKAFKLGDICEMNSGGTPRRGVSGYYHGSIKWAKISDIEAAKNGLISETEETITPEGLASINNRIFPENTLLLAMYGSVGKTAITTSEMSTNQAILGIRPKNGNIDLQYLKYWFETIKKKLLDRAVGGTLQNISLTIVKDLEIPLPPLPLQQKIVAILDKADSLRQKDKQLLKLYDDLAQSVFYEMFGDPVRNERGWDKMKFEEVVAKDCPLTYGIVQPGEEFPNGVPVVRPVDLEKKYITKEELKKIDPIISNKFKRTLLKGNELLLSVRGSVGLISYATSELIGSNVTRGIVPIWMDETKANNFFIYALFKNEGFLGLVKGMAKGATLIQINLSDLREMMLIVPPLELQSKFDELIKNIENQLIQADRTQQKSEALFQSLLQRAFKGELIKE